MMKLSSDLVRREVIETAETLVVKVGTNVISRSDSTLDLERIASLVDAVRRSLETGRRVVVVASGAVGAGIDLLEHVLDLSQRAVHADSGNAKSVHGIRPG